MLFHLGHRQGNKLRSAINDAYLAEETAQLTPLLAEASFSATQQRSISQRAEKIIQEVRLNHQKRGGIDAFIQEYHLNSQEGVVLMCLAEALLRIPDRATADALIHDKLVHGNFRKHLGSSQSLFVNASTWALVITGSIMRLDNEDAGGILERMLARGGEPFIRTALKKAMRHLGDRFVMGQTMPEALYHSQRHGAPYERFSFDMLGEAALTRDDAERYFNAYAGAIDALAELSKNEYDLFQAPSISIKLSALHPRYEFAQRRRTIPAVHEKVHFLAVKARELGVSITLDAEEADRLELMLDIFTEVFLSKAMAEWEGFGLAVQAYQKRAPALIDYLTDLSWQKKKRIPVRLVKGAYWDSEIKRAQERGLENYPVFTRKTATDVCYLACARRMLASPEVFYAQFATHNAHTAAAIIELSGAENAFEFQRLYGMGEDLYHTLNALESKPIPCRIYAPVGPHADLLPYLIRRLLENGANSSFVYRILNQNIPVAQLCADPAEKLRQVGASPHPQIPLPAHLYLPQRRHSAGLNLDHAEALSQFSREVNRALTTPWRSAPIVGGVEVKNETKNIKAPHDLRLIAGTVTLSHFDNIQHALFLAHRAAPFWNQTPAQRRAEILERAAVLLEQNRAELTALLIKERGKTLRDSLAEIREAVDYCYYYAHLARTLFQTPQTLPGPTGESNRLFLHGRGIFVCISPWNFPLAIFTGQITAALAAGNSVVAKPSSQTPLIAYRVVKLLHKAGIPVDALHLLPGDGKTIGNKLISDPRVAGVAFTGSTETARAMNLILAARPGPIIPFIAETGGLNAMIVDSSAPPEQVVTDVLQSAFNSAGQRCSSLRILFLQEEIADRIIGLLCGACHEWVMGDPGQIDTDLGPVIDEKARKNLQDHRQTLETQGHKLLYAMTVPDKLIHGCYFPACIYELKNLSLLRREVFGPILHVVRYYAHKLEHVIEQINNLGYGLTLGIHSRIDSTADYIIKNLRSGNTYVNRNMIGAVVGVQPFGGEALSGTGPKAGGPHYLYRFSTERTVTINTTAVGGNTQLFTQADKEA